jgi:glucose/arabinose dehydrogenase
MTAPNVVQFGRAAACLVMLTLGCAAIAQQPATSKRPEPLSATKQWDASCLSCHGATGAGDKGKGVASLLTDAQMAESKDQPFFEMLKKGDGPHAAAQGLDDQEVWSLVVHLREMQFADWRKRVGDPKPAAGVFTSNRARFKVETVIDSGLNIPWSIAWLPPLPGGKGGSSVTRSLVTEKDGRLNLYYNDKLKGLVFGLPKLVSQGQGGLMDVAPHPDYEKNGWIYLSFAEASTDGRREMTKIVRGKLTQTMGGDGADTSMFTDQQVIFQPRPEHYNAPGIHYGSRIVFQKPADGIKDANGRWYVHFSVGERGGNEQAQDLDRPNGKMHRLWDDGQVPADNPFPKALYPSIWTKGHRNQQGVCFDDRGNLWDTEHGPRGGDELNLIKPGSNYGWPQACFGINYSDKPFVTPWKEKASDGTAISMPVHRWLPSIAACGLDCARAAEVKLTFPDWAGDLFAGGLAGQTVQRIRIKDGKMTECEEIVHGLGRVRDVAFGPDGLLYIVLNGPDKVVRLVPAPPPPPATQK